MFKPSLTILEARETPSATFIDPNAWSTPRIPGWDGPVQEVVGDFLGRSTPDNPDLQRAFVAGVGGSVRVVIRADSPPGTPLVVVGQEAGAPIYGDPAADQIVFDKIFFNPATDRMGGTVAAVRDATTGRDDLAVAGLKGAGPVVAIEDIVTGAEHDVLVAGISVDYRGGVDLTSCNVHLEVPAVETGPDQNGALIITPAEGGGGGPVLTAIDSTGRTITSFLVGPAADRSGLYQPASAELDVDVAPGGHRGLGVRGPDGRVTLYDWHGQTYTLSS